LAATVTVDLRIAEAWDAMPSASRAVRERTAFSDSRTVPRQVKFYALRRALDVAPAYCLIASLFGVAPAALSMLATYERLCRQIAIVRIVSASAGGRHRERHGTAHAKGVAGMRLKDRVAIVTGGSQGIGEACARRFAAEGAKVAIVNRDRKKAAAVVDAIRASGGESMAVQADVGCTDEIDAAVAQIVDAYGTVHILLNNAGVYLMSRLGQTTEAAFDAMINTNLKGVFFLCQSVLPFFERQGHGKIINIGSIFGHPVIPTPRSIAAPRVQSCW
jgi:hypothetical protein